MQILRTTIYSNDNNDQNTRISKDDHLIPIMISSVKQRRPPTLLFMV